MWTHRGGHPYAGRRGPEAAHERQVKERRGAGSTGSQGVVGLGCAVEVVRRPGRRVPWCCRGVGPRVSTGSQRAVEAFRHRAPGLRLLLHRRDHALRLLLLGFRFPWARLRRLLLLLRHLVALAVALPVLLGGERGPRRGLGLGRLGLGQGCCTTIVASGSPCRSSRPATTTLGIWMVADASIGEIASSGVTT
ncbi:hypothetical protein GCM10029964_111640 [Kibdelosporangium lantanae]